MENEKPEQQCYVCKGTDAPITKGVCTFSGRRISLCKACRDIADSAVEAEIKKTGHHGPWLINVSGKNLYVGMKEEKDGIKDKD